MMPASRPLVALTLLALTLRAPAQANDEPAAPDAPALELSLTDALLLAIRSNTTVEGARLDAQAAIEGYGEAWGAFDSAFFADVTASKTVTAPTPSNLVGGLELGGSPSTKTVFFNYETGFRGTLLTGTTWQIDVGAQRVKRTATGLFSDVYTGSLDLSVSHPLLRGGGGYARRALELARKDVAIAAASAMDVGLDTLEAVVAAYWNLYFAFRDVETKDESVTLAQELVDITTRKFDQGLQTRIDQVEAEAELARRKEERLTAVNVRDDANDELLRLVFGPRQVQDWERRIVPTTEPGAAQSLDLDLPSAIETSLRQRPDVAAARLRMARSEVELQRAENQLLPRLDVTAGLGTNSNQPGLSEAVGELDDRSFFDHSLVLGFEIPIGNRAAGYALRRARITRQREGVNLREAEMTAIQEVRSAVRGVRLQEARVDATSETTRLNRELYAGERRRLENDLSTPFQVRQTLQNLLAAIDTELRARLDREVARTRLLAAQGLLLDFYGVPRASPPRLEEEVRPPAP